MRYRYRTDDSGSIHTLGVNWIRPLVNLYTGVRYALWKAPGGTSWAGRGEVDYYPTRYMVLRLEGDFAHELLEVEAGHKWKVISGILRDMVIDLERGNG